jgi:CheY-like chemotaxis protein
VDYGIREGRRPLHPEDAAVNPAPQPCPESVLSPVRPPAGKTTTVLIVEDHAIEREGLATVLRTEDYAVVAVETVDEGLAIIRGGGVALVLLDMMQPGHDGWHFLAECGRNPTLARVPVIITTALGVASPEWAHSLGAVGCFRKPLPVPALLAEVRRLCATR